MTLISQGRSRERVLLFGMEGTGKSLAALDIAARVAPNKVHIIDNDNAWDRMLEGTTLDGREVKVLADYTWKDGEFLFDDRWCVDDGNVIVWHVDGWEANVAAVAEVRTDAQPDDWCCIDSGSTLWANVQDWYTDTVYGKTLGEYLLAMKRGVQKEEDKDDPKWQIINAQYAQGVGHFIVTPPCHLIITAESKDVNPAKERDREIKNLYAAHFARPAGQKRMGHNVQTVIQLTRDHDSTYHAKTLKDRGGRERFEGDDVTGRGFGEWYLEEVGGWTDTATPTRAMQPKSSAPKVVAKS